VCGIVGALSLRRDVPSIPGNDLTSMISSIRHRGPDEAGLYRDERVGLGSTRLSIVDLAGGHQPMSDWRGQRWIVFNGEIYNFIALRAQLMDRGHRFRTRSDTEVVLAAYSEWGRDGFRRLEGQFAVAIWDPAHDELVLARDRFGVRPLYISEHEGRVWFASEVKALFAGSATHPRAFDPVGVAETFTFWTTVAPQSVFQGVVELEPGHSRTFRTTGADDHAYWRLTYPTSNSERFSGSKAEAAELVRNAVDAAVRKRIVQADVPVGAFLSGGLDSSIISALGRHVKGDRFTTFSIRFTETEYDETAFQRRMAQFIGSDHRELVVEPRDVAEAFPRVIEHAERPLLRTAPAPIYLLARLVRESGIKVVLTGEGADEQFAGYDLFREARIRRFWARRPESRLRPMLMKRTYSTFDRSPTSQPLSAREFFGDGLAHSKEPGFGHAPRWRSTSALKGLLAATFREQADAVDVSQRLLDSIPSVFGQWSPLNQDQYLECRTLLSGYLLSSQGDRMLMAHSVEGRYPFLDDGVVTLASMLPDEFKLQGLNEKSILKVAARDLVPSEILNRPKQPYRAPDVSSLLLSADGWAMELLDPSFVSDAGVFDPAAIVRLRRRLDSKHSHGPMSNRDSMAIVGVLSTGLLYEQLIKRRPSPSAPLDLNVRVDLTTHPSARRQFEQEPAFRD
jgi:asparagine synthase (glutamine-hydrolysing)